MSIYKVSLENLEQFIKNIGAGALTQDIVNLKDLLSRYEDLLEVNKDHKKQAALILQDFELYGDVYYKMEDWLAKCLAGNFTELPCEMESEYLNCALRVLFKEMALEAEANLEDEEIENMVEFATQHFSEDVFNMEFLSNIFSKHLIERNQICKIC